MKRALLLLPLLLLPAACSGETDDGGKAAYLKQAESVCARAVAARAAAGTPTSTKAIPAYVRQIVTVASDTSAELNALEPPAADAAELDTKLLAPLRDQVGKGQAFAKLVEETAAKGDDAAVLKVLGSAPLKPQADLAFMKDYGFVQCVKAADTSA